MESQYTTDDCFWQSGGNSIICWSRALARAQHLGSCPKSQSSVALLVLCAPVPGSVVLVQAKGSRAIVMDYCSGLLPNILTLLIYEEFLTLLQERNIKPRTVLSGLVDPFPIIQDPIIQGWNPLFNIFQVSYSTFWCYFAIFASYLCSASEILY